MIRRRWFQFSLRGFLVALTVFAVWLGWNVERTQGRERAWRLVGSSFTD